MRSLAEKLGVKPMALYHHITNKNEILDGIVDVVFSEIDLPQADADWRSALRDRAMSARSVLRRHSWAAPLMESRTNPGPATLRHHDAVIGTLRRGGFSIQMTAHAYALLDSYVYGFRPAGGQPAVRHPYGDRRGDGVDHGAVRHGDRLHDRGMAVYKYSWWDSAALVSGIVGLVAVVPFVVGQSQLDVAFGDLGVQINLWLPHPGQRGGDRDSARPCCA